MRPLSRLSLVTLLALAGAGCGTKSSPPAAGPGSTAPVEAHPASPGAGPSKPGAPIDLHMTALALPGTATTARYEIVLTGTPRRDVDQVELAIEGHPAVVASARAGMLSEARATVEVGKDEGKDLIGTAVVMVDGKRMGAATQVHVGAAAALPAGTLIQLPDGTWIREVRP